MPAPLETERLLAQKAYDLTEAARGRAGMVKSRVLVNEGRGGRRFVGDYQVEIDVPVGGKIELRGRWVHFDSQMVIRRANIGSGLVQVDLQLLRIDARDPRDEPSFFPPGIHADVVRGQRGLRVQALHLSGVNGERMSESMSNVRVTGPMERHMALMEKVIFTSGQEIVLDKKDPGSDIYKYTHRFP